MEAAPLQYWVPPESVPYLQMKIESYSPKLITLFFLSVQKNPKKCKCTRCISSQNPNSDYKAMTNFRRRLWQLNADVTELVLRNPPPVIHSHCGLQLFHSSRGSNDGKSKKSLRGGWNMCGRHYKRVITWWREKKKSISSGQFNWWRRRRDPLLLLSHGEIKTNNHNPGRMIPSAITEIHFSSS